MAISRLVPALLAAAALAAGAAEVAGVTFEPRERVGSAELTLNGAGLRKRAFFQVYAIGLYLPEKRRAAAEAIGLPGPKRVAIHMLRDVGAEQFTEALAEGLRDNHSEADFKAIEPRMRQFVELMKGIGEAKKGMRITLDWTGAGTVLSVDGRAAGAPISGEDFYRALLRVWLGERPVQADLKPALLGAAD